MKISPKADWKLVTQTLSAWRADHAPSMGAAIAFYTLFSIAPLLLIVIAVAGYFFGQEAARGEIVRQLTGLVGTSGAQAIEGVIVSANASPHRSFIAGIGIVAFLIGSTSVFNELQDSLNRIWKVPRPAGTSGFFALIRTRLLSFGLILAIAFLLMVSLLVSAVVAALHRSLGAPAGDWTLAAQLAEVVLNFGLITGLFALIYKVIPQRIVLWSDVWIGAATTSMLFSVGKLVIGIYLGNSNVASVFGQIGSFAVFLLWVYYSAQIFLLGAEFTSIYSSSRRR